MISGRQVLSTIEQVVARARSEEARFQKSLETATEEAARLRLERMEAFRELARLKLDPTTGKDVLGELDAAERRALTLLAERRATLERLTGRRRTAEDAERRAEAERHDKAAAFEAALKALQDQRARVEADTRISGEWAAARARVEAATAIAGKAEAKAAQAESDQSEKRRPYEADPLFMYLWGSKFGTAEYRSRGLVRFLDRQVARLVGYDTARANYALLNEIPQRLREHATRVREEVEAERRRLQEVERAALLKAGIEPLEARAAQAKAALDGAERKLAEAKSDLAALDRMYDSSVLEGDAPYREATELLAQADAQQDLTRLYREAVTTPSPRDEAIIRRIEGIETALGEAERKIGEAERQAREYAQRRSMIERERDDFRRRGYDHPSGSFGNETVLSSVLGGVLGGLLQGTVLRDVLQGGYQRQSGPWDSDFGGGWIGGGGSGGGWIGGGDGGSIGGDLGGSLGGGLGGGDGFDTGGSF
jgi:hypothetical protein